VGCSRLAIQISLWKTVADCWGTKFAAAQSAKVAYSLYGTQIFFEATIEGDKGKKTVA
jgi:hypothetical protein